MIEGRSLVTEAIRALVIACRAWAAYPSDHPNVTKALGAAQARVGEMLSAHGSVAVGATRTHLRVGPWTLEFPQARALAQALYQRHAAMLRFDRGIQSDELRALVQWLAGQPLPLEPGSPPAGPPGLPEARHVQLQPLDYSAVRLTDSAEEAPDQPSLSLAGRLLDLLLEGGTPTDARSTEDPERAKQPALPAELAMVSWLTEFLRAEVARERADEGASSEGSRAAGSGAGGADEGQDTVEGIGAPGRTVGGGRRPGAAERPGAERASAPAGAAATVAVGSGSSGAAAAAAGLGIPSGDEAPDATWTASGATPRELLVRLTEATTAHLQALSGAGRALVARQTAQLIMRLPEPLRESLMRAALRVLAVDPDGEAALEIFASSLTAHPVLRVLRQLEAQGVPLSRHALRLVELLASSRPEPAEKGAASGRDLESLRAELVTLFREEDIDRYNPEDHLALLARAMLAWPTRTPVVLGTLESLGDRVASLTEEAMGRELTETLLDLLSRHADDKTGPVLSRLERLVQEALARGSLDEAAFAIEGMARLVADETVPPPTRAGLRQRLDHLAGPETLPVLAASLGAGPGPAAVRLTQLLGPSAIRSLLQVLAEEKVRVRRRRVFDLLAALGPAITPEATRWLTDARWYVVRNIIALLRAVGDRSSLGTIRRLTGHDDLRVRLEALRSLLELDPGVGRECLLAAIADPDARAATAAVELAGQHGGPTMVEPLLGVLASWDLRGRRRAVRLAALQALGRMGLPEALPHLAHLFRERWVPFPPLAERRAAYQSLEGYPPDNARAGLATQGLRSRDPEIRAVCERLLRAG